MSYHIKVKKIKEHTRRKPREEENERENKQISKIP
jgi:hypothetical protein